MKGNGETRGQGGARTRTAMGQGQAQLRTMGAGVDPMLPTLTADQLKAVKLAAGVFNADRGHRVTRDRHGADGMG